jgi:hypothetical protein
MKDHSTTNIEAHNIDVETGTSVALIGQKGARFMLGAMVMAAGIGLSRDAAAGSDCRIPGSGNLCFYDYETNNFGKVSGTNPVWANLPGHWGDRADAFWNFGNHCSSRLYVDTWYRNWWAELPRGIGVDGGPGFNITNSNDWFACQ